MKGVFVTGTDTGIGKTFTSQALVLALAETGLKVAGLKPIASGFELRDGEWRNDDVDALTSASNVDLPAQMVNRYSFKPAIAPHIAAEQENQELDLALIKNDVLSASQHADFVVVEGVGGWHVPLSSVAAIAPQDIQDLAQALDLPVIMVVGLRLGCLNHAILTAQAIIASGLPLLGWVANHVEPDLPYVDENLATLESILPVPKLFELPFLEKTAELDTSLLKQTGFVQSLCNSVNNS